MPKEVLKKFFPKDVPFITRPNTHKEDWIYGSLLGSLHALVVTLVYHYVPEPYMDEIFHIGQTRRYCEGNYTWDPMITTPPALYVISMPLCGGYERYINSLLFIFFFVACSRFRRMFQKGDSALTATAALLLPVLLHSSILYYTDLLSVVLVVTGFSITSPVISSIFFLFSCFTRQTNIVWAGLYALVRMYHHFDPAQPFKSIFRSVFRLWSFVFLAVAFLIFVYFNKGIVLGDPSAHQPKLHFAQGLYFMLFSTLHAWPYALRDLNSLVKLFLKPHSILITALFVPLIHYFSFDHPYLLADNRHVPFYLWRWWLRDPTKRIVLAPLYTASFIFLNRFSSRIPVLIRILFTLCTLAVVVPAHLIEPRYFIVPYILWRLSARVDNGPAFLEIPSLISIFSIVFYLFVFKPFEWSHEPGTKQRFMW